MPLKFFDRISGINEFALEVANVSKGKDLIINDRMLFSNLSYELRNYPIKILMPYNPKKSVTNHFQLTSNLNKDENKTFYLIGSPEHISYLSKNHKTKLLKEINKKFISEKIKIYEVSF